MKAITRCFAAAFCFIFYCLLFPVIASGSGPDFVSTVNRFEVKWLTNAGMTPDLAQLGEPGGWKPVDMRVAVPANPNAANAFWLKITLPELPPNSGILFDSLSGQRFQIVEDGEVIYDYKRSYLYDSHRILLPLYTKDSGRTIYLFGQSVTGELGISHGPLIGDFQTLSARYANADLLDMTLGSTFLFVAVIMLICSFFLNREQLPSWLSLSMVILTIGILIVTYCPFLFLFYGDYGHIYLIFFDVALFLFLPFLMYFFENMIDPGPYGIVRKFRKFLFVYSSICLGLMIVNELTDYKFYGLYDFVSVTILGIIMIVQFLFIIGLSVTYAIKGYQEAIVISIGFGIFTCIAVGELVWFYKQNGQYNLFLWKWGLVGFVFSLIVVLGKRLVRVHEQVVNYSKELEIYNHQLQRSEKMEIISQLAASVAHEVRNPLQVTRGFLQLLGEKNRDEREARYLGLAIEELDRASAIITNYLTFAKPELEEVTALNLAEELRQVEGILIPLANLQGGRIDIRLPDNLYVVGSSPKLKQAIINIMKNSIESFRGNGRIQLWGYEEAAEAVLHILDNGEGMDKDMLNRLGEPYFSSKTKGTGLGLMVTFRIIEAMNGKLIFKSEKGKGTEAIIRLPLIKSS